MAMSGLGDGTSGDALGAWLVEGLEAASAREARWLAALARFDRAREWAPDGASSCADWLVRWAGLARSTAFEKLRVAHELDRRPRVAAAFAAGDIGYCAVREITRAVGADVATDDALIEVARIAPVLDVRQEVRRLLLLRGQDRRGLVAPRNA